MKILTSFFIATILMITLLSTSTYAATFEIQNNCSDTVWAAAVPGGGRKLTSGETWILNVANGTSEGRIWARTNCTFNANGRGSCQTGDCGGVLGCKSYGSPPVTLAEYALNQHNNLDFLDISLVDGFNVPMQFSRPSDSCTGGIICSADINDQCPGELRAPGGCNNPCTVFKTDQYCCLSRGNCGPTNYSMFFKNRCPDAYSYPNDDQTSTFTCPGGSNYRVVFCPETLPTFGAQTGVCYGRLGSNLPSPADVVALCNQNNIRSIRIYDPHQPTLQALRGSNIEVILGVPNTDLQNVAASQANANNWVQNNVRNYPNVRFRYIAVGNEVSPLRDTAQYKDFLLPAIRNIFNAISAAGLGNQIKVTTAVETGLVGNGYPPSSGTFLLQVQSFITPIVQFLARNGAPLLVNVYPYFSYTGNSRDISLEYALFTSSGIVTPDGVRYQNLFDALVDATYSALEKAGGSSVQIVVSESGWPTAGEQATSTDNARTYNNNLIRHANGNSGTPKRPGRAIETYIFALFDEDQKSPEYEKHFGVFLPNRQPKYPISF